MCFGDSILVLIFLSEVGPKTQFPVHIRPGVTVEVVEYVKIICLDGVRR